MKAKCCRKPWEIEHECHHLRSEGCRFISCEFETNSHTGLNFSCLGDMDPLLHAGTSGGKGFCFFLVCGEKFGLCECFDVCSFLDGGINAHGGGGGGISQWKRSGEGGRRRLVGDPCEGR